METASSPRVSTISDDGALLAPSDVRLVDAMNPTSPTIRRARLARQRRRQKLQLSRPNLNTEHLRWKIIASLFIIIHLAQYQNHQLLNEASATTSDRSHPPPPLSSASFAAQQRQQVSFAEPESANNVQVVAVGRSVRFKCVVNNIGDHKVAWFHKDRHILLAIGNKTVAWRERIQVSSQADSVFVLQIDSVQLNDKVSRKRVIATHE